jgi:hypothetical protein
MLTIRHPTSETDSQSNGIGPAKTGVEATAEARLRQASYVALHHVSCRLHDGVLTLRGRVPSYYLKQIAQTLLYSIEGVLKINNELDVISIPDPRREHDACLHS